MAIAPKAKTPVTAAPKGKAATPKTQAPAPKAKAPKAEKEERGPTRNGMVVQLLLEKKHSDETIKDKVNKAFAPLVVNNSAIPVARANINKALSEDKQIERLFDVEGGKVVPKSKLPPKEKPAKRAKVDPAKDVLKTVANIDVHTKAAAKPMAAKPKAALKK